MSGFGIFSGMPREQKTPQEKKRLELEKDHFTFSNAPHAFRKNWKKKKSNLNRQYRRKADQLLAEAKPEISADNAEIVVGHVTAVHLKESVLTKRLRKSSTVSLGEKVQTKLQKRKEAIGRRVSHKRQYDEIVHAAMKTLLQLEGDQFKDAVDRIARLLQGGDPVEWSRLYQSKDRLDRAIFFVEQISRGNAFYLDALRRDQELCLSFQSWKKKVNRILARARRPAIRKLEQKIATEKKLKAVVRASRTR